MTPRFVFLTSRSTGIIILLVITITVLSVWLLGLGERRSVFENAFISLSILAIAFYIFLWVSLFRGVKLKDDLGKLTDQIKVSVDKKDIVPNPSLILDAFSIIPDSWEGLLLAIFFWILIAVVFLLVLFFTSGAFWAIVLVFAAALYWVFFRALRMVFKNSNLCKGKLLISSVVALFYTMIYIVWFYGIVFGWYFLKGG